MELKFIGHVGVDSGQLLLCDPCYIDSQWEVEDFEDVRVYEHKETKDRLQYRVHFENYNQVIPSYDKTMNDLLATGNWISVDAHNVKHNFSYNACAKATLSRDGYGELRFKSGISGAGVAFSTVIGDGMYPVFAVYDNNGNLLKVEVILQEETEEDSSDFPIFNS